MLLSSLCLFLFFKRHDFIFFSACLFCVCNMQNLFPCLYFFFSFSFCVRCNFFFFGLLFCNKFFFLSLSIFYYCREKGRERNKNSDLSCGDRWSQIREVEKAITLGIHQTTNEEPPKSKTEETKKRRKKRRKKEREKKKQVLLASGSYDNNIIEREVFRYSHSSLVCLSVCQTLAD